ncbi:MAG: histidine kinase dimerization/phosphoacceptor domain -containing protein [Polyangiaceae bacterium]
MKNNLQIISSLLSLHGRSPAVRKAFDECRDRIHAMSLVHEKLHQSASMLPIDTASYLKSLIDALLRSTPFRTDATGGFLSPSAPSPRTDRSFSRSPMTASVSHPRWIFGTRRPSG